VSARILELVTRRARAIGLGALAACVALALANRLPEDATEAVLAAAVAVSAGVVIIRVGSRALLPGAAIATAGVAVIAAGSPTTLGWFSTCVLVGWCVLEGGPRIGLIYWAGALLLLGGYALSDLQEPGWVAWIAGMTLTLVSSSLVRSQLRLVEQLRAAQADLAERSRAQERNRIARDLHDVIAHSLTVSLLHVCSARLAVEHEPQEAAESLAEAERLGRRSLDEVRSIVGLMRPESGGDAMSAPVHGLDGVEALIDEFRRAGTNVTLAREGDLGRLPATTGSVVYRIVQEALTNAARHAPGSDVAVRLAAAADDVQVVVDSDGAPGDGSGLGSRSMRERSEAVGGSCDAGPHGTGWRVRATLPMRSPRGAAHE